MTESKDKLLNGAQAAEFLGVKPATIYAYVSRGLIDSIPGQTARERCYRLSDLKKLRQSNRGFKAPKESDEPTWTGPVIKSAITEIRDDGHRYRGKNAIDLVRDDTPFEAIIDLLWETPRHKPWSRISPLAIPEHVSIAASDELDSLDLLKLLLVSLEISDPVCRKLLARDVLDVARRLLVTLPVAIGLTGRFGSQSTYNNSIARSLLFALSGKKSQEKSRLINSALVLCADHELNASALASRIAASRDASLYSCLLSALSTFSGTLHGSASRRAEDLVTNSLNFKSVKAWLKDHLREFEQVPGFGTELYQLGDPRARFLLEISQDLSRKNKKLKRLVEIVDCVREHTGQEPNLDIGLAAMSYALSLRPGSGTTVFAVSRAAGWIAHGKEQRRFGGVIRPRARYIGKS